MYVFVTVWYHLSSILSVPSRKWAVLPGEMQEKRPLAAPPCCSQGAVWGHGSAPACAVRALVQVPPSRSRVHSVTRSRVHGFTCSRVHGARVMGVSASSVPSAVLALEDGVAAARGVVDAAVDVAEVIADVIPTVAGSNGATAVHDTFLCSHTPLQRGAVWT